MCHFYIVIFYIIAQFVKLQVAIIRWDIEEKVHFSLSKFLFEIFFIKPIGMKILAIQFKIRHPIYFVDTTQLQDQVLYSWNNCEYVLKYVYGNDDLRMENPYYISPDNC